MKQHLMATFLSVTMLLTSAAQAMQIQQFDKMADQDQADYITILVQGAEKILNDEGQNDLANKMDQLFTEIHQGDTMPVGMIEFEDNLARARVADAKRVIRDPNARRLEVEDAMIVTMRKNGIELPPSFLTVAKNFKPKLPPQGKEKKERRTES